MFSPYVYGEITQSDEEIRKNADFIHCTFGSNFQILGTSNSLAQVEFSQVENFKSKIQERKMNF